MLTFILGPDGYLARSALAKLSAELDPDGMNIDLVDGRAAPLNEIATTVNTPAFFGGPRTVVIDGFLERLSKSKTADDGEAATPKGQADALGLLKSLPASANIVFFDRAAASLPAAVRKILPDDARILLHEAPRGPELIRWMQRQAEAGGAKLPDQLARKIAETLFPKTWTAKPSNPLYDRPPELERLAHEIEKLTLAAYPNAITAALVDEMLVSSEEDRLFPLVEAVCASDLRSAIKDLARARDRGDDPNRIANSLYQQAELAAALDPSHDAVQVGQEIGLPNPNRMYGVSKSSQRSKRPAKEWVRRFVETERAVKRGALRDPWDPLYRALDND